MKKRFAFLLALCLTFSLAALPASALEVDEAKELLQTYYVEELPPEVLEADSLEALLEALNDPYTVYLSDQDYQAFLSSVNGESVVGIGVSLQTTYHDGYLIMSVLPGSPALEAGLEAGDRIVAVDGTPLTESSDITGAIGGQEGTSVTITVIRQSDGSRKDFTMERRKVVIPIVTYDVMDGIGVIDCISFGDSTAEVIQEALETRNDDVSVWILDLRSNPGGTASSASASVGFFFGQAVMAYLRDADGNDTYYFTPGWPDLTDKPLIVLTSPYSASGSELFAGAARDLGVGIAIGQRTYGKGIAQIILDESNTEGIFSGDGLKLTAYRFYSPEGTTNHIVGVLPTLLLSVENTPAAALLLGCAQPEQASGHLKLELAGHTFYLDLKQARSEEYRSAFQELLEALPPSAVLYKGSSLRTWTETTPEALAAELGLSYAARSFSDLEGTPFRREIETLAVYRLLSGYEDGTFRPEQEITRAEFCTMIASALNLPANDSALRFTDTSADAWYADDVSAMAGRGFLSGYEDGTFRPNDTITYQEMVTILSAVACWANMNVSDLNKTEIAMKDWLDYDEYDEWAQIPARNLDSLGALVGDLAPTDNGTRQVAAGMLCTLMESLNLLWDGV